MVENKDLRNMEIIKIHNQHIRYLELSDKGSFGSPWPYLVKVLNAKFKVENWGCLG
jgi:hypothetical protein